MWHWKKGGKRDVGDSERREREMVKGKNRCLMEYPMCTKLRKIMGYKTYFVCVIQESV